MPTNRFLLPVCGALGIMLAAWFAPAARGDSVGEIRFNRDIRPILSDKCFACHGPDQAQRKADLRLDVEAIAKGQLDGLRPIVPGQPEKSEVFRRITSHDPAEQMPPPDSGKQLTKSEIESIGRWITAGAAWEKHWAFTPPVRPSMPQVEHPAWLRNPIDAFVLARLEAAGLEPGAEADRTTLARRVTLDLTGLPPAPDEVDEFLRDDAPQAYERWVDRLLASPRYGERMAARWLDAARYADTSGYQTDGIRYMWRWRDWVIDAYNRNLPFDQFTIAQLAGDLVPGATLDDRIATGFNRNHRGNAEGGIIPEEYAVEYVVDRVQTTATVWLGLTLGCARCHDHKFDPVTQREFYQLFALFNNLPEKGRAVKVGNSPPLIKAPTHDQQQEQRALAAQLAVAESRLTVLEDEIASLEAAWATGFAPSSPIAWVPAESLAAHFPLDGSTAESVHGKSQPSDGAAHYHRGMISAAADFDGHWLINAGNLADFGYFDRFTFSAWIFARAGGGTVLARMSDVTDADGYSLVMAGGKLQVNLVKRWLDDALRVETAEPLQVDAWHHIAVTYDGSRVAEGVRIYVDGQLRKQTVLLDELNQSFHSAEPLRIGGGGIGPNFDGLIDEVRVYETDLDPVAISLLATGDTIDAILKRNPRDRPPSQAAKLRAYFLAEYAPPHVRQAQQRVLALRKQLRDLEDSFPTTMVMEERSAPRESFVLIRGQYDKPGPRVTPGVPQCLGGAPSREPRDRLELAHWLVDPANPVVARVAVNRLWQTVFAAGLVRTVDDFGAQGEPPSHPQLLDWLAVELVERGWDTKALVRLIVTSAAYRQSSKVTPAAMDHDPENRLLSRGPRFRLPAEMIRDQALAASGLLVEQLGGPSVKPYQPPGLWKELTGGSDFEQDHGRNLYRRSLYTFWKRTIAPPSMMTFDAAGRETCSVRETRTNTPLQALALLNEVTYVEAARALAQRVMREASTPSERISLAFRRAASRPPAATELAILTRDFERQLARFRERPADAEKFLALGEAQWDSQLDPVEVAAYAAVANLILNLDEVVTKE